MTDKQSEDIREILKKLGLNIGVLESLISDDGFVNIMRGSYGHTYIQESVSLVSQLQALGCREGEQKELEQVMELLNDTHLPVNDLAIKSNVVHLVTELIEDYEDTKQKLKDVKDAL